MFIRPFGFVLCLLLCVCSLFGLYRLQAQPQRQERQPPPLLAAPTSEVVFAAPLKSDVQSDFTQTIIRNNLFAPLGTNLHDKPRPGANLVLVATVVSENASRSTALIKNASTGRHHVLSIGEVLGDFQLTEIQPKAVTLSDNGKPVVLRLPPGMLLNTKRR